MFNFDAETFVIFYPNSAGGRFLELALALDKTIHSVAHSKTALDKDYLFNFSKRYLAENINAHIGDSGHLPKYIPEEMEWSDRYVFCVHQAELPAGLEFFRKCKNLKPILIDIDTHDSEEQLRHRRAIFSRTAHHSMRAGYTLYAPELKFLHNFNNAIKLKLGVWPCARIEMSDYWNPNIAIPALEKIFQEQNINNPGWQELYQIWHSTSIAHVQNHSQEESNHLSPSGRVVRYLC